MSISIAQVDESNLDAAAEVHAISWRASHREICRPEFVAAHTTARQREYLRKKLQGGSCLFLLMDDVSVGLVTVTGNLIEDLYVLPDRQGQGYGTLLLQHAIRECSGTPTLWVLETNCRAAQFYKHRGFRPTGSVNRGNGPLAEIEFVFMEAKREKIPETRVETDRLLVRRLTENDAEALHAVLSDPEVMRHIEPPFSLEQTKAFIRNAGLCDPPLVYAVVWKQTGELIGHLIWHPWDETSMELGWILRRDFWGRRIAKELTAAMLARTSQDVIVECSPAQTATRHIAEVFGFHVVAVSEERIIFRRNAEENNAESNRI